jgi:hypothetical protein
LGVSAASEAAEVILQEFMLFSETALGKSGPSGEAVALFMVVPPEEDQVSGVGELRFYILKPYLKH